MAGKGQCGILFNSKDQHFLFPQVGSNVTKIATRYRSPVFNDIRWYNSCDPVLHSLIQNNTQPQEFYLG